MNKTIMILILSVLITAVSAACGAGEVVLSERDSNAVVETVPDPDGDSAAERAGESTSATEAATSTVPDGSDPAAGTDQDSGVYVYVCGEVVTPGVYCLQQGARIYEAVTLAGGFTSDANVSIVNQAETVTDGMMIRIPAEGSEDTAMASSTAPGQTVASDSQTQVNINTADMDTLMTLPGIGETKAVAIIAWRQENGGFTDIADIRNVSGIGDSTYERLRTLITVTY